MSTSALASAAPFAQTTDPGWSRPDHCNAFERFILTRMCDERDLIFIQNSARITAFLLVTTPALYLIPRRWVAWCAVPYLLALLIGFTGRYILMLHATSHRQLFKKRYAWMNAYIPWVLGPFFGQTPNSYYAHHLGMHHAENNMLTDLSGTMGYQRDSFLHWLHYWARFFFVGIPHLVWYLHTRRKHKILRLLLVGEISWYLGVGLLLFVDWQATLVVFVMPFLVLRVAFMSGNWGQHAFVDVDDGGNPFRNSNCITETRYNHECYNDGYHIVHHLKPSLHWSEMARYYDSHRDHFLRQNAVVFQGLSDNQAIWLRLMLKDYDTLARHLVDLGPPRSQEDKVAFLKDRVRRRKGSLPRFFDFSRPAVSAS